MPDREKVIKGLESCLGLGGSCKKCPYKLSGCSDMDCRRPLLRDALALLKKQQKTRFEIAHEIVSGSILMYQGKELVRCNDCKHGIRLDDSNYFVCSKPFASNRETHTGDWFCADGEKNDALSEE